MIKKKKESAGDRAEKKSKRKAKKRERSFVPNHRPSPSSGLCLALSFVCVMISLARLTFGPFEIREYSIVNDTPYSVETLHETVGELGGRNYLLLDKEDISSAAIKALPYLKSLEFDYVFPFKMTLHAIPERIVYYSEREDGVYVFNEDLKLIETRSIEDPCQDLGEAIKLKLPEEVTINQAGFPEFEFSFKAEDVVSLTKDIAGTREGSVATSVDFSDPYNIKVLLDEKYLICFGGLEDRSEKLSDVTKIFAECAPKMFEDRTLRIDVSVKALPTYTFDISLNK